MIASFIQSPICRLLMYISRYYVILYFIKIMSVYMPFFVDEFDS
jgi:hypothetical protein